MKSLLFVLLIALFFIPFIPKLNSPVKLSGKPISSDSESLTTAFDGDLSTDFKSEKPSNGWIGLQLDSQYKIKKIGVAFPKDSKKEDYLLGIIEGSNDPTFLEADPLYMITEEIKNNEINYFEIKSTQKYEYIRYLGPNDKNCIISELEVYEDSKINTNLKSMIVSSEQEYYYQATNLPLMIIHTEEAVEPVDKENYITCSITIIKDNKIDTKGKGKIKLRGNKTMELKKKPYKIKFDDKQSPLGMPANAKKWNLLANHGDKTLLRTRLAFKISSLFEMKYTPACLPVDLMVNGEYKGNFDLCDQVEQGKGRVEIEKMSKKNINEPEVTGGYIIEVDLYAKYEENYFVTKKGIIYSIKYPDEEDIVPEQTDYINNTFNLVEEDVYNNDFSKIDIESFCKFVLIEDLCANPETFWSTYLTKERLDDKFYFGPVWDFDIAFDNDIRVYPAVEKKNFIFKWGNSAGTMNKFALKILSDENTIKTLKEIWNQYNGKKISKEILIKFINDETKNIYESQKLNFMRWDVLNKTVLVNPVVRGSFEAEVEYLKEFVQKRFDITDEIVKIANSTFINYENERNTSRINITIN